MGIMALHRKIAKERKKKDLPPKKYRTWRNKEQQAAYDRACRKLPEETQSNDIIKKMNKEE